MAGIREAHQEAVHAICKAGSLPAAGRLRSTMVWCQVYGASSRRGSVWAVSGAHQPAAAWTRRARVVMVWLTAARPSAEISRECEAAGGEQE
jgi:hypothetical protein